jgi:tetratricopeptide (TPR) repeat protein
VTKPAPGVTPPATANSAPEIANKEAKPFFDQGLAHLKQKKHDLALSSFRAALEKYPAESSEPVALMMAVDKANVYEQIAAVQFATGQTDAALDTLTNSLKDAFEKLSDAHQAWSRKRPKSYGQYADLAKPLIDTDVALLGLTHPSAIRLDAVGRRYIGAVQAAKLNEQQLIKSLAIGFIKLGAGEISAVIFQTTANLNLTLAQNCKTRIPNKCGPGSPRDQVLEYSNKALANMNDAIAIAPAVKANYEVRAEIFRFMGRADLAAADEAKAASMK